MKIRQVRLGTLFFQIASIFVLMTSFVVGRVFSDDELSSDKSPVVLASIVVPSEGAFWQAAENIASEMKFRETIQGLRMLAETNVEFLGELDPTKPSGLIVMTNGDDVFAFAFLPVVAPDSFYEEKLAILNGRLPEQGLQQVFDDVFIDGSNIFFCMSKFREQIPTQTLDKYVELPDVSNDSTTVVSVNINLTAIPDEFLEASMAGLRQQISQKVSESELSAEKLDRQLDYYSNIVDSLKSISFDLVVDDSNDLICQFTVESKNGSLLAQQFKKSSEIRTRWNVVAKTNNAAFATVKAGTIADNLKEDQFDQLQGVAHNKLFEQLEVLLDDPDDLSVAKEIVTHLESSLTDYVKAGKFDGALAVSCDPPFVSFASSLPQTNDLEKALVKLGERLKKDQKKFDDYVKLDDELKGKFSISKLDVPLENVLSDVPNFFKGKSLVVRLGMSNDAAILLLGLDAQDVDKELSRLINSSDELSAVPNEVYVQFAPVADLLCKIFTDVDNVRPAAMKTLEKIASAKDAKFVVKREFNKTTFRSSFTITKGFFQTAGDVVRINMAGDAAGDVGEDLDNLFDEDSEE